MFLLNKYNIIILKIDLYMEEVFMKKIVKKFTVALIVAMMAVMMIPFSVAADDTYTVYADVPDSWGIPNIWAWTDGGGNVFDAWPGEEMEAGEDGFYVAELPKTALNFLINYNGDENKTRDIKVTGADCKIVVNDDLSVSIEYLEELETPEETEEPTTKEDVQETTTEQPATQAQTPSSNGLGPEGAVIIVAIVVVILIVGAIIFVMFKKQ